LGRASGRLPRCLRNFSGFMSSRFGPMNLDIPGGPFRASALASGFPDPSRLVGTNRPLGIKMVWLGLRFCPDSCPFPRRSPDALFKADQHVADEPSKLRETDARYGMATGARKSSRSHPDRDPWRQWSGAFAPIGAGQGMLGGNPFHECNLLWELLKG